MYSRIEEERLQFIRRGRIHEAHEEDPDIDDDTIDIRLPVSFLGSKEWSSSETADALALAREFGPPSFFITMTLSCTIFRSAFFRPKFRHSFHWSHIAPTCQGTPSPRHTRHSPSLSVIFRHAPSRSVTSLHFPSLRFIFRLHFIFHFPSSL